MNLDKVNQMSLSKLKEKMGLVEKVSKRCKRYLAIVGKGFIEKQEVINLRSIFGGYKRNNLTDSEMEKMYNAFLYPIIDMDNVGPKIVISEDHTQQGLQYLRSLYLTPTGKLKKVNKFDTLESTDSYPVDSFQAIRIIEDFSHFQFNGFMESYTGYGNRCEYKPVWTVIAKDGSSFDYVQNFSGWCRR